MQVAKRPFERFCVLRHSDHEAPNALGQNQASPSCSTLLALRQLCDIQQGTRNGAAVQLMKMAIVNLTNEDLVSVAAYVSSRPPVRTSQPTETAAR